MPNRKILFIGLYLIGGNFVDFYNTLATCLKEWSQLECDAVWADAINKAAFITDGVILFFIIVLSILQAWSQVLSLKLNEDLVCCKIELK